MIDDLVDELKADEGWVPFAYQDHLGFWTIGHGFLIDQRKNGHIPEHIAEEWLRYAANEKWQRLATHHPWLLDQPEKIQRAVANMAYNLGVMGVLKFKKMLAALEAGDRELAAKEALDSRWAEQVPNRAKRVTDMIRGDGNA